MSCKNWVEVYEERARQLADPRDICECYIDDRPCDETWFKAAADHIADLLQLHPTDRTLEVGCGCGNILQRLTQSGGEFVGVDPASSVLEKAKELLPQISFHEAYASKMPFPDAGFDKCFSYQVIHYFPDLGTAESAILEMRRVVKPGGRILLGQVPNAEKYEAYQQQRQTRSFVRKPVVSHSLEWLWYSPEFFYKFRDCFADVQVRQIEQAFDPIYRYRMDVLLVV